MRKLWITNEDWPATQETLDQAASFGANEILHGIPKTLEEVIPQGTVGYFEYIEDSPVSEELPPVLTLEEVTEKLQAIESTLEGFT